MPTLIRTLAGFAAVSLAAVALAAPAAAQDVLIAPTRVVLSGGGSAEVVLANIGQERATYRIEPVLRRMDPSGRFIDVDPAQANPTEQAALAMVRFAPRRITLDPNQPQSVRISAHPGPELADGEYRVHLSFHAIPKPVSVEPAPASAPTSLSIRLTPIYGMTIPVIIRKGQLDATASLADPRLVRTASGRELKIEMNRTGTRSVYGELVVTKPGAKEPVYAAKGIAVYPEVTHRTVELDLSPEQAAKLTGPLHFEYREMPENGGKLIAALDATLG